jgi:hypothetical protein
MIENLFAPTVGERKKLAKGDEKQMTNHVVRNFAEPVIERLLPRDGALREEASAILREAAEWLDKAIACYDDELDRQNCMAIVEDKLYSLARFMHLSRDFQDAVTLLHIVARNAEYRIFTRQQLGLIEKALLDFQTLDFGPEVVDTHWNAFFEAGIDVDLPFRTAGSSEETGNGQG